MWLVFSLVAAFLAQASVSALILRTPAKVSSPARAARLRCAAVRDLSTADVQTLATEEYQEISYDALARKHALRPRSFQRHLAPGPVALSWATGAVSLASQALITDSAQLAQDAALFCESLRTIIGDGFLSDADPSVQLAVLYSFIYVNVVGTSFFVMPNIFPPQRSGPDARGERLPMEVPRRSRNMAQHKLNAIDFSYITLNTLCMPGFFYHVFCLLRSWGFDPAAPPPPLDALSAARAVPEAAGALALYFVLYEFVYYHWHRAMHEVPALYTYVHRHHHQSTYPDRPAIDTLNTGCVESQVGLYLQLGVCWACGEALGVRSAGAAAAFITAAGCLSVLEHDRFERALPFGFWRADDHHMHHAAVRCNYSPYSPLWDTVFGTHKPHAVKQYGPAGGAEVSASDRLGTATSSTVDGPIAPGSAALALAVASNVTSVLVG